MNQPSSSERISDAKNKIARYRDNASHGHASFLADSAWFLAFGTGVGIELYRLIANPEFIFKGTGWIDYVGIAIGVLGALVKGKGAVDSLQYENRNDAFADNLQTEVDKTQLKGE